MKKLNQEEHIEVAKAVLEAKYAIDDVFKLLSGKVRRKEIDLWLRVDRQLQKARSGLDDLWFHESDETSPYYPVR